MSAVIGRDTERLLHETIGFVSVAIGTIFGVLGITIIVFVATRTLSATGIWYTSATSFALHFTIC